MRRGSMLSWGKSATEPRQMQTYRTTGREQRLGLDWGLENGKTCQREYCAVPIR